MNEAERLVDDVTSTLTPLHIQIGTTKAKARVWQRMADGITACAIHQVMTEAEVSRARQRLVNHIGAAIAEQK